MAMEHKKWTEACEQAGELALIRHSKGLYPVVNPHKHPLLGFLPYHSFLSKGARAPLGNANWHLAREVLALHYSTIK